MQEGGKRRDAAMLHGEAEAVHAGREEHGVAEAEKAGIAEEHVVADGVGRKHENAGEIALMIGGKKKAEAEQEAIRPR